MGMPQIPENINRPSFDELIIDLLESVALDHMALSHLINAEGERLQELINKYACNEIEYCQLESSCLTTNSLINNVIMKEWLLLNRLNTIIDINKNLGPCPPPCPPSPCGPSDTRTSCVSNPLHPPL